MYRSPLNAQRTRDCAPPRYKMHYASVHALYCGIHGVGTLCSLFSLKPTRSSPAVTPNAKPPGTAPARTAARATADCQ